MVRRILRPIISCGLGIALLVAPSLSLAAELNIVPTTTYAKEAANNTSAATTFQAQINGNTKPGNVSKSPTKSLLYPGNTTKVYAHFMGWFGTDKHMNVGYSSTDAAQVRKQVADMKSRGISGAVLDWYGEGHITDTVAQLLRTESEAKSFTFAITEDVGAVSGAAKTNNCDVSQKLIQDLNYAYTNYETSSAYMRVGGRPVVFFFGVEAYYVDWSRVRAQVSGNPLFIFGNAPAFTDAAANGGFAWIAPNRRDANDINIAYLDNFYSTAKLHPERIVVGTGYPGFNDALAGWIDNRVMYRHCGRTWMSSFTRSNNFYSTLLQLPLTQIGTWNDYEEGTEIETGVDNCLNLVSWTSGSTLYWSVNGDGPPESISYFRVFISLDGMNLMKLGDVSGAARSLSLSSWPLSTSTTYKLYVKAVGRPSFLNKISNVVGYRAGNAPPTARIHLSSSSGALPFSLTVSTSTSSDSDGRVVSSKIDFGDGTILSGPTATHLYSGFDVFTVRAYVTDDRGATSTVAQQVTVKPATSGVVISKPTANSTVSNIFRVTAYASGANPIKTLKLYVDGNAMLTVQDDRFDINVRLFDGTHTIGVNAWDSANVVQSRRITVLVGSGSNQAPFPVLGLTTVTPMIGARVRACTAASTDPEKSSLRSVVNFGDGSATVSGTTTYHTYTAAGSYVVKATVTDNRGKSATTSTTVYVH